MDPIIGTGLALIFGLVALLAGIAAVATGLADGRIPWKTGGVAAVSAVMFLVVCSAIPPGYSEAERDRVEALHQQFAPALERYRQAHGQYPPTLEAAGIPTPQTEYGPLRYLARMEDGASVYTIAFGDYFENGFAAWWDSKSRKWYLDT